MPSYTVSSLLRVRVRQYVQVLDSTEQCGQQNNSVATTDAAVIFYMQNVNVVFKGWCSGVGLNEEVFAGRLYVKLGHLYPSPPLHTVHTVAATK